ncbi:hypothetical protein D9M73_174220 [compost metagenome]
MSVSDLTIDDRNPRYGRRRRSEFKALPVPSPTKKPTDRRRFSGLFHISLKTALACCRQGNGLSKLHKRQLVGASLLAMDVNDNARCLSARVVLAFFASRLAPTGNQGYFEGSESKKAH